MLTLEQALELKRGQKLRFGGLFTFDVVSVEARKRGVYIMLLREGKYSTFATENDLHKAELVTLPGDDVLLKKEALTVSDTREVAAIEPEGEWANESPSPTAIDDDPDKTVILPKRRGRKKKSE